MLYHVLILALTKSPDKMGEMPLKKVGCNPKLKLMGVVLYCRFHVLFRAYHWSKLMQSIRMNEAVSITTAIAVAAGTLY